MEYLFGKEKSWQARLKNNPVFVFLDYDGTLAPIVDSPEKALMNEAARMTLAALLTLPACKLAIISGRSLRDIKQRVGIKGIIYSGNHGLEIEGPRIDFKEQVSLRYKKSLEKIKKALEEMVVSFPGAFVEDKGLTLSLHYRLLNDERVTEFQSVFHESVASDVIAERIRVRPGKKVLEIRPPVEWDKGKVVLWLLARQKFAEKDKPVVPVYVGDDKTDEDAFRAIRKQGITVAVGNNRKSHAQYYVKSQAEVIGFLSILRSLRETAWQN